MSETSPGPWSVKVYSNGPIDILAKDGSVIAEGVRFEDARLLAAAWNMRDALFRICDADSLHEARSIADEALAAMGDDE